MAQIFVSAWLTFSRALVAQKFTGVWLTFSLTFTLLLNGTKKNKKFTARGKVIPYLK
jgi:hypothetical protein